MKVFIIGEEISPPWTEAIKNMIWGLANSLSEEYEVYLWKDPSKPYPKLKKNIHFVDIFDRRVRSDYKTRNYAVTLPFKMKLLLDTFTFSKKERIDVVHLFSHPRLLFTLPIHILKNLYGTKVLQTIPSTIRSSFSVVGDKNVIISSYSKRIIRKSHVIPPGIPESQFKKLDPTRTKKELGINDEKVILTNVGSATTTGLDTFIKAAALLKDENFKFIVANKNLNERMGGIIHENMKKLSRGMGVDDKIIFLGLFDQEKLLSIADVVVLPLKTSYSKIEFPLAILEAWAKGTLVLGSNVGALPTILEGKGLVFKANDPKSLAGCISKAVKNDYKEEKEKAKKEAREYVWGKIAKRYEEIYNLLYSEKSGRKIR